MSFRGDAPLQSRDSNFLSNENYGFLLGRRSKSVDSSKPIRRERQKPEKQKPCPSSFTMKSQQAPSASTSSIAPSSDRHSLRSITGSFSSRKRGREPSSFIETEASPSFIHSYSNSQEEQSPIFSADQSPSSQRPDSRDPSFTPSRISIVRPSRPQAASRLSTSFFKSDTDKNTSEALPRQKSVLKRMSWGWNQAFAGNNPEQLTEVEAQRADYQLPQYRPSTATSERSTTSSYSAAPSTSSSASPNRPFANRRLSIASSKPRVSEPDLPTVKEEPQPRPEAQPQESESPETETLEQIQDPITGEMHLRRTLTKQFHRTASVLNVHPSTPPVERKRPQISLPTFIHSTNAQLSDSNATHPALRADAHERIYTSTFEESSPRSSNGYSDSDNPGMTDASSLGSRSSNGSSPVEGRFAELQMSPVAPNHLTQYFSSAKPTETISVVSPEADAPAPALPSRAPSHSKHEHERLARSRSVRSSAGSEQYAVPTSRHTSLEAQEAQPYHSELSQLEEVQEDFNAMGVEEQDWDKVATDEEVMGKGYRKCTPSVYMMDLADMEAGRWD